ncbi:MAG: hypothetical protein JNL83_05535 [Myxococcales bacterium]|nr:hypothetical protein [Myxococcales bacterium]
MSDSLRIELGRDLLFATLAGDPLPAHGVELVLSGNGRDIPPAAHLVFTVAYHVYEQIVGESLFGLVPDVRGNPGLPFERGRDVEIDADLRPELVTTLIDRGGGARELITALLGEPEDRFQFIALTESWLASSVVQEIEAPVGGTLKSGYKVAR